jgi:hypothetical protein
VAGELVKGAGSDEAGINIPPITPTTPSHVQRRPISVHQYHPVQIFLDSVQLMVLGQFW